MKKGIIACFAMLMLLAGSTVAPAEARWYHGGYGRPYMGYGYGYPRYHNLGLGLGLGLAGLGVGLGLGGLGSRYYDDYYYNPPVRFYNPPVRVYTAPAYGYYGNYWY